MKTLPLVEIKRHIISREKHRRAFSFLLVFLLLLITTFPSLVFAENIDDNDIDDEKPATVLVESVDNNSKELTDESLDTKEPETFTENVDADIFIAESTTPVLPENTPQLTGLSDDFSVFDNGDTFSVQKYIIFDSQPYGNPAEVIRGNPLPDGFLDDPDPAALPDGVIFEAWYCSQCDDPYISKHGIDGRVNNQKYLYAKYSAPETNYFTIFFWDGFDSKNVIQEASVEKGGILPEFTSADLLPNNRIFSGDWMIYEMIDFEIADFITTLFAGEYANYAVEKNLILVPQFFKDGGSAPPDPEKTPPQEDGPKGPQAPQPNDTTPGNNQRGSTNGTSNTGSNGSSGFSATEIGEVSGLIDDSILKTITPSKTPLYPNHEVDLSPIFPPLTTGSTVAGFNFALTSATIGLMLLLLVTYFTNGKKDLGTVNKHGLLRLISIAPSIASLILLVPTQDFNMPLRMADSFTAHHAAILLMQLLIVVFARKSYSYDNSVESH